VNLEGVFASTVKTNDYFVFLTEVGSSSGLYVASQSSSGFVVSSSSGNGNATFNYRIVAHRADVDAPRNAKVGAPSSVAGPDTRGIDNPPQPIAPPRVPDNAPGSGPSQNNNRSSVRD